MTTTPETGAFNVRLPGRIVLLLSGMLPAFAISGLTPVLPAIATHFQDYPNAPILARLLVSSIGFMIVIGAPIAGAMADRFGARRILMISVTAYAVAGCAGFLIDNLYGLLVTRLIVGFATAAFAAVALGLLVLNSSGLARNRWLGYMNVFTTIAAPVLIPIASFAGNHGWQWPFLIHAFVLPLLVLSWIGFDPDPPRKAAADPAAPQVAAAQRLPSDGIPWNFLIFATAAGIVLVTQTLFVPFHLRDLGIVEPGKIGLTLLPSGLASAFAAFFFGAVRARVSMNKAFVITFWAEAVGLTIVGLSQTPLQAIAGLVIIGLAVGIVIPNLYTLAAITGPDVHRTRTMGFAKTGLYGGPLIGQLLLEPIVARSNVTVAIILLGVFALLLGATRLRRSPAPVSVAALILFLPLARAYARARLR